MRGKATIPILAAALAASPAAAENWRAASKTDGASAFIDTASIRRDGDRVTFVREVRYDALQDLDGDTSYDRLRARWEADCRAMTLQSLDLSARLGEKVIFSAESERGDLERPEAGTNGEATLHAVCRDQWPS